MYFVRVKKPEQLEAVLEWDVDKVLILDWSLMNKKLPEGKIYYSLPDVSRESDIKNIEKTVNNCPEGAGLLVKNLDEVGLLIEKEFKGPVMGDAFLYAYNNEAFNFYKEYFPDMLFILSDELTDGEAEGLKNPEGLIYKIYGHQQLMITNQCVSRNYTDCREKLLELRDERGNNFYAESNCANCYSVIYNGQSTYMLDKLNEISYKNVLLDFTIEDKKETAEILKQCDYKNDKRPAGISRGHHYKGVD